MIQGGVNLLEQTEEQEKLLESSARELEERQRKEEILKKKLKKKEAEKHDIEVKYATLQEEATGKTLILKEVWKQFQHTKEEVRKKMHYCISPSVLPLLVRLSIICCMVFFILFVLVLQIADMKAESQRENEDLLDMIRELSKEVKLQTLVINTNVPPEYQKDLEDHVEWHEETEEWHMVGNITCTRM